MLLDATKLAASGDVVAAWELIEIGVRPVEVGFRASAVAGFLRNQSLYAEADQFAKLALTQPWSDVRSLNVAKERAEVRYWCAWLATEVIGDRKQAAVWIEQAAADDPASEPIMSLRSRLADVAESASLSGR